MKIAEAGVNRTIPYTQGIRPYHTVLAELVAKYAGSEQQRLFDFGCGVGNTLVEIARLRPALRFVIADLDQTCIRITSEKVPVETAVLLESSAELAEIHDTFDLIIASHTLHYDPEPLQTLRRLLGLLRPGGYLLLASPNPSTPTKILHNVIRRYYSEGIYTWDRSVLKNFVESVAGVRIVEITHDYLPLPLLNKRRSLRPLLMMLSKALPWLSFSIIMVITKE